jgi:membrane protease YdiL (CAAX protease family)
VEPTQIEATQIESSSSTPPPAPSAPSTIAPVWHTILLVAAIIALSIHGASRLSAIHGELNRLATYGLTAATELAMLAWVIFGLRLRKIPLRSLLGSCPVNFHSIVADLGFALLFWITSMMVLGSVSVAWSGVEAALTHHTPSTHASGQIPFAPDSSRLDAVRQLARLAPANGREVAAWALLCLLAGFVEEIVFRGYLQRQFIAGARGRVTITILASAAIFGAAHGYQGARSMVLLSVFGVLFSLLALDRHSLRPGIFAHAGHDIFAGLALAWLRSSHIL